MNDREQQVAPRTYDMEVIADQARQASLGIIQVYNNLQALCVAADSLVDYGDPASRAQALQHIGSALVTAEAAFPSSSATLTLRHIARRLS